MRTNEERLERMHQRAGEIERERRGRLIRFTRAAAAAAGLILVVLMAVYIPGIMTAAPSGEVSGRMNASIFSGSSNLAYIVTAVIAFLLGMVVTVLCWRLKKWQDLKNDRVGKIHD